MSPWLTIVGIGEDGFSGLGKTARHALLNATCVFGGQRQLDLLPVCIRAERLTWPSPFSLAPVLPVLEKLAGTKVIFANDCIGPEAEEAVAKAKEGEIVLLENEPIKLQEI